MSKSWNDSREMRAERAAARPWEYKALKRHLKADARDRREFDRLADAEVLERFTARDN